MSRQSPRYSGRHRPPNSWSFLQNLATVFGRSVAAVAIAGGVYLLLASIRPPIAVGPAVVATDDAVIRAPTGLEPSPSAEAEPPVAATSPSPTPTPSPEATVQGPPPAQTTVQVLDAAADPVATQEVVTTLRSRGYQVVVVNVAVRRYAVTTVFYSDGSAAAAAGLTARIPQLAEVLPNDRLSPDVDLHVVVGADWRAT